MKLCAAAIIGEEKSGKHTVLETLIGRKVEKERIETVIGKSLHMKIERKIVLDGFIEFICIPSSSGLLFCCSQILFGVDAIIAIIDIHTGMQIETEKVIIEAAAMHKGIIVIINKIDLFSAWAEIRCRIKSITDRIEKIAGAEVFICIASAKYTACIYFGLLKEIKESIEEIEKRYTEMNKTMYMSYEDSYTFKKYIWSKEYLHLIDKEKSSYKKNKIKSTVTDILVNAHIVLHLAHCIHKHIFTFSPSKLSSPHILGCTVYNSTHAFIVHTKTCKIGMSITIGKQKMIIEKILGKDKYSDKQSLFLVQFKCSLNAKKQISSNFSKYNIIQISVKGITSTEADFISNQALGWPAISVSLDTCFTSTDTDKKALLLNSYDPFLLEAYMYEIKTILDQPHIKVSSPLYYKKKVLTRKIQFKIEIEDKTLFISVFPTNYSSSIHPIHNNTSTIIESSPIHYIQKDNLCTMSTAEDIFIDSDTLNQYIKIFQNALSFDDTSVPFAYIHFYVEKATINATINISSNPIDENNSICATASAKNIFVHLKRAENIIIEKHVYVSILLSTPRKVSFKKYVKYTKIALSSRTDTIELLKMLAANYQGNLIDYKYISKSFCACKLSLPASIYTSLLATLSSIFPAYSASIYNIIYA